MAAFGELGVMPEICRAMEELGWMLPRPIQTEAIPLILGGGDVLGAAETGSGKTAAFGVPVLQIVHETLEEAAAAQAGGGGAAGGGAGGGGEATTVRIAESDKDGMLQVSGDGLTCFNSSDKTWMGARGNMGVKSGCYFYEAVVSGSGIARLGWSTAVASLDLGTDGNGFGYGGTGKKANNRSFDTYGEPFGDGDVIGCYLSLQEKAFYFTKNGVDLGQAFSLPAHLVKNAAFFPAICVKGCGLQLNFGPSFKFRPFDGYNFLSAPKASDVASGAAIGGACGTPIALLLAPARDLAEQTYDCLVQFGQYLPEVKSALFVGGVDIKPQMAALKAGVHIAVGTPGRLLDMIESGKLRLDLVRFFVLDEADRLLETGNLDAIMKMYGRLNKSRTGTQRLQTLMFSATLHSPEILSLAAKITAFATWVDLKGKDSVPESVHHLVYRVDATRDHSWGTARVQTDGVHARDRCAPTDPSPESRSEGIKRLKHTHLIKVINALKIESAMIFCRTNLDCDNLEAFLIQQGGGSTFRGKAEKGTENRYSCVVLAGMRSMDERKANLQHFKDGDVRFLVCTDVAARGIDIQGLPYVINLTLPDVAENYIHRIGRVGRADAVGLAISIVATEKEKVWFHKCANKGKGCSNTRLLDQGGCTIWYDEPSLLKEIENRVGHPIEELPADLQLRKDLASIKFGADRDGGADATTGEHIQHLRPTVQQLTAIEKNAQDCFLNLQLRFARTTGAGASAASGAGGSGGGGRRK